jgi:hypothetical protein
MLVRILKEVKRKGKVELHLEIDDKVYAELERDAKLAGISVGDFLKALLVIHIKGK